jgi:DNA-3-methyladenine glycosylase II
MWFDDLDPNDRWTPAITHLRKDRTLAKIIERVGPCTLTPVAPKDCFIKLVQSILSQQVSTAAAASMYRKLSSQFPRKRPTPERLVEFLSSADEETIRSCGLSRQKRAYILDLSSRFASGEIKSRDFATRTDEELVAELTPIKGIGRWTVEMLLIFALNRPDVWPVDDLGIQESVFRHWPRKFKERPKGKEIRDFAEKWKPWRSVASWYLWRGLKPVGTVKRVGD